MLYLAFLLLFLISRCKITVFTPFHKGFSPLFFQPVSPKRPNHLKHKQIRRLFSCRKNLRCVPCVETPPNSSAKKAKIPWWSQDFAVILRLVRMNSSAFNHAGSDARLFNNFHHLPHMITDGFVPCQEFITLNLDIHIS